MALKKIGASIVLDGEKEYRQALKNIQSEQKELRSEMTLCSATYKDSQNSIEALTSKYSILQKEYDKQAEKVRTYAGALENAQERQQKASENVEKYSNALAEAEKSLEEMKNDASATSEAIKAQEDAVAGLQENLAKAQKEYDKSTTSVNNWQTGMNIAEAQLADMDHELEQTGQYLNEAKSSTDGCAKSIDEFGKEVDNSSDKTLTFADVLKANLLSEAIVDGIKALANGVKQIADSAVASGASFESAMSQVAATMGITADEIQNGSEAYQIMEQSAKDCGATTKYSASEAAEALNYLALAGYDAEKSAETLPKVLNLAAAGGLDLATASDMVTDAMAALGLETSDLDNYIDEMARTSQKSNTSVSQLGEATLVVAGTVTTTGQSLEVMNGELGVLANNGIKGAEGGTHLRNVLLSLVSPSDAGAQALKNLNVSVTDSSGNIRDLDAILNDLNASIENMSESEKTNMIATIFNKTDISAVNALLKGTNGEFDSLYREIKNCSGAASDMADTMNDNLTGKITIFQSALEGLQISLYDVFDDTLKDVVDAGTDAIGRLDDSVKNGELGESLVRLSDQLDDLATHVINFAEDAMPKMIDGLSWLLDNGGTVASVVSGIGAGVVTYTKIIPLITSAVEAYKAYQIATEGATVAQTIFNGVLNANPIGLVVTAIAALTTAVAVYATTTQSQSDATNSLIESYNKEIESENNAIASRQAAKTERDAEIVTINNLKTELEQLNSKETLTNEEQTRMAQIVKELNEEMPDLNLQLDEQTGHLQMTNEELEKNLELQEQQLLYNAAQEDLTEIADELYQAEKTLNEMYSNRAEEKEKLNALESEYNDLMIEEYGTTDIAATQQKTFIQNHRDLWDAMTDANASVDEYTNSIMSQIDVVNDLQGEYDSTNSYISQYSSEIEAASADVEELTTTTIEWNGKSVELTGQVASSVTELQTAYLEAKADAEESLTSQIELFGRLDDSSDLTASQMADNLRQQTDTMNQYSEDMTTAMQLVEYGMMDEGLLGSIKELGISGAGYLHELVTSAEDNSTEYQEVMKEWAKNREALDELAGSMADFETDYTESMNSIIETSEKTHDDLLVDQDNFNIKSLDSMIQGMDDLAQAVTDGSPKLTDSVESVYSNMLKASSNALGMKEGQSSVYMQQGEAISQSMADGITNNSNLVSNAVQTMLDNASSKVDDWVVNINRKLGELIF